MSESTGSMVECPICGEQFDPQAAGGWCTNSECGEWQYEGTEVPDAENPDEGAIGEPADETHQQADESDASAEAETPIEPDTAPSSGDEAGETGSSSEPGDATASVDSPGDLPESTETESAGDEPTETARGRDGQDSGGDDPDSGGDVPVSDILGGEDASPESAQDEPGVDTDPGTDGPGGEPATEDDTETPDHTTGTESEEAQPVAAEATSETAETGSAAAESEAAETGSAAAESETADRTAGTESGSVEADSAETESETAVEMIECPGCGEKLESVVNFCPSCGEDVSEFEPGEDEEDEETACPSCGADVAEDDRFCASCGQDLTSVETLTECPSCGADVDEDDRFCASCGEDLDAHRGSGQGSPATATTAASTGESGQTGSGPLTSDETDSASEGPAPESLVLSTRGEEIAVTDGDTVGRELRRIITQTGGDEDEAVLVHREHVRFVRENGTFYLVDLGKNPTRLNGQPMEQGDRKEISPGDELDLSGVVTLEVSAP